MAYEEKKTETETAATPTVTSKDQKFVDEALKKFERGYERERTNIALAFEDLEFRAGEQWPQQVKEDREREYRPSLTINRIPTFVRQVTGDIRLMRPSIRVVPVNNRGDAKTAEVLAGLIRYVENRSDAKHAYSTAADSQVVAGIGHWRVMTEYAGESTFDQELRISAVDDGVSVIWDPDAKLPNREDAKYCFVPVDISHDAFKERYPGFPVEDFEREASGRAELFNEWWGDDFVRVAEYWYKEPETRKLALLPGGAIDDITDETDEAYLAQLEAQGARIEEREGFCVYRSIISCAHILEKSVKWPGRYIPIIPVIGEEVIIGKRRVRHGIVRNLKDPQRMYNYFRSAETEAVALQPKAPFVGTEKNFERHHDQWTQANQKNFPFLQYVPDPKNNNIAPQRISPAVNTNGILEGLQISAEEMKAVVGIYDAGLGNRSNETSGKAILARQRESDVGTVVYVENFARAIRHTGRIVLDLIPHIYDTERVIRIVGEDGKIDLVPINNEIVAMVNGLPIKQTLNDVTVGAYDVVLDQGPSYTTKREEARDGMTAFLQSAPNAAPLVLDLIAEAQDWPNAEKFSKRLKTILPQQIQAMEQQESGEPPPPPAPPSPEQQMQQLTMQIEFRMKQLDLELKELSVMQAAAQPGQAAEHSQALRAMFDALRDLNEAVTAPKRIDLVRDEAGRPQGAVQVSMPKKEPSQMNVADAMTAPKRMDFVRDEAGRLQGAVQVPNVVQ
jgi:hypothetical protein